MNRFSAFLLLSLLIMLAGCGQRDSRKVIILSTGRMAGNAYPQEAKQIAPLQHYPYLSGYIKKVRREAENNGDIVLLIDSGDSLGGSFAAYATDSMNMVHLMNALRYDAVFLGNLDADVSPQAIKALAMPVICPFVTRDGKPALTDALPTVRIEKAGLKIDLFANFYGTSNAEDHPQRFPMWFGTVNRPVMTVRDYQPWKNTQAPDLTLLNWMKFESGPTPDPAELQMIQSLGADAILAHKIYSQQEHAIWQQQTYPKWPVPVSQNILRRNRGFTLSRLELKRQGDGWTAVQPPELIQLTANTSEADPEVVESLSTFGSDILQADQKVGNLPSDISRKQILDAYLQILRSQTEADVIVSSINSIRDHLESGPLKASRLFDVLPWTNDLEMFNIDRDAFRKLSALPELRILRREQLPAQIKVVSSKFFARLIARELELDPMTFRPLGTGGEFDLLTRYLRSEGVETLTQPPSAEGWIFEGQEP
jgi:hypothetical protein